MSAAFVFCKDTLTVFIQGELDHHTAKQIRSRIDSEISRRNPLKLELDFSQVSFMDSSGIGLVMGRYKLMSQRGGKVFVLNPTPPIKRVMQISGIGRLAKILYDKNKEVGTNEASQKEYDKPCKCEVSRIVTE